MDATLGPFYGGDHRAHAERIFDAHIAGGTDRLGYFSVEQHMFIATLGEQIDAPRLGMVHVVAKRQETVKISPLIVAKEVRGRLRVGPALLNHAEKFARGLRDRAIYCTVAEANIKAMEFFRRSGFVVAGRSDSHYMPGVTETMLYKLLSPGEAVETFDAPNISVEPMEQKHRDQVRALLLASLPQSFLGIDDSWVDALFAGYERRHRVDVNQKYKLIFVATDRDGGVLGVAGATPKKGEPIKIMPLIATTRPAFSALITDIPFLLRRYGRKLYAHLSPGVDQTIALQRRGWKLDAALPAAYHASTVTQQWSLDIDDEDFMRTMRVKQRYLDYIKAGTKPLEVRVAYDSIKRMRAGEKIRFASRDETQVVLVREIRAYSNFDEMAKTEDLSQIVPGQSDSEVMQTLKRIYPPDKERLGVVVLDVEPLGD
jgi:ASC-1-like (ASCH) protein/ribosomal protein S18 acetylase RimI-like enzyme